MIKEALAFVLNKLLSSFTFWNVLCVFVTLLCIYWWRKPHSRFPPGPRGIPLLGNIPFLGPNPSKTIKKWSLEKYGPVMSVRMGRSDLVFLNTFDAVNSALVKQNASYSDRPPNRLFRMNGNHGIPRSRYDESFKIQKQFGLKFLREKGLAGKRMDEVVNEEGDNFVKYLRQFEGKPVNLKKYFHWLTLNVISQVALGKRHDYGDPDFLELFNVMASFFNPQDAKQISLISLFPFLSHFPVFSGAIRRLEGRLSKILDTMQKYVDEHKRNFDPNNINDFIDAFIYEQKFRKIQKESFTDEQLRTYCQNFFFAGSETTSSTLSWFFVFLLNYPEYHKMVEEEIKDCIGAGGVPMMSHREKMPLTCAFIQEVMRIRTLAPLSLAHMTSETTELMGYIIPKGTEIMPNLTGVHMDPVDWPQPEVFNPRRHIDETGKFVPTKKIIPFSVGSRFCLGESLARVEIFVFFVKLIQNFHIRSAESLPPPMDQEIVTITVQPTKCEVILEAKQ